MKWLLNFKYSSMNSFISNIFLKWDLFVSLNSSICSSRVQLRQHLMTWEVAYCSRVPASKIFCFTIVTLFFLMFGFRPTILDLYLFSFTTTRGILFWFYFFQFFFVFYSLKFCCCLFLVFFICILWFVRDLYDAAIFIFPPFLGENLINLGFIVLLDILVL